MIRKLLLFKSSSVISKCHSTSNGPLNGIKVLDLTRIIAGPMCSMILADFGADVYKIEVPGRGDDTRRWPPIFKDGQTSSTYIAMNRNKKSICIDFKTKRGQDLLKQMAQKCDVLVENYVPGVLKKYSLDYDSLKEIAPHLIYCSVTGFGSQGPYAHKPGVDMIAASLSGHLYITGPENGEPCRTGTSNIDMMTGLRANSAIIAALYERQKTGLGRKIDSNLFSTAVASLKNYAISYLNFGTQVERLGTEHSYVVPYKCFKSKDGYITLGAINDSQFKTLCELFGKSELITDERFATASQRANNRKALIVILVEIFEKKTTKEWCDILEKTSLPHGPLNDFRQASATPPTLRLKCHKPKSDKSVRWNEDTVDNEHMNKKKSKCCCIYKKPKQRFDESSESESDECDNCFGHVEVKKAKKLTKASCSEQSAAGSSGDVIIDHPQPINPSGMTTVST